jgi:hypothetical protein
MEIAEGVMRRDRDMLRELAGTIRRRPVSPNECAGVRLDEFRKWRKSRSYLSVPVLAAPRLNFFTAISRTVLRRYRVRSLRRSDG